VTGFENVGKYSKTLTNTPRWNRQSVPKRRHIIFRRRGIIIIIIIIIIIVIIIIYCNWFVTRWQWLVYMYTNMKLFTTKFNSGGLHKKHVVTTWNFGCHLSRRHTTFRTRRKFEIRNFIALVSVFVVQGLRQSSPVTGPVAQRVPGS